VSVKIQPLTHFGPIFFRRGGRFYARG